MESKEVSSEAVAHSTLAKTMAEDATAPPRQLTEKEFRQMRRVYFTVRHDRVAECGHRLDKITEPRTNCEYCWWAFFSSHGELVQVTDRAFQEQGPAFVDKMRGVHYRKMFVRYMSTLARFQKEAAEAEKAKANESGTKSENEVGGESRSGNGQEVRAEQHVHDDGEQGGQADSQSADRVSVN